jgi:hypothetical protein
MEVLKTKFLKLYADLPLGLRSDIVVVLDDYGPISWNAAYVEIDNNTAKGGEILNNLEELGII